MTFLILIETLYVHASMYVWAWSIQPKECPKTRLNENVITFHVFPILQFITWTDFPTERFPLQLIAYYVLYRINIAGVYTGVCENLLNDF